jgi:hypothetical protein
MRKISNILLVTIVNPVGTILLGYLVLGERLWVGTPFPGREWCFWGWRLSTGD